MEEPKNSKQKGGFFGMIITQTTVTLIILLSVITVKYFFKNTYPSLKEWYSVNICAETDINEVLENEV